MRLKQLKPGANVVMLLAATWAPDARAIMAGDETALPPDSPSAWLDLLGAASPLDFVGALAISAGGFSYLGSGAALSPTPHTLGADRRAQP